MKPYVKPTAELIQISSMEPIASGCERNEHSTIDSNIESAMANWLGYAPPGGVFNILGVTIPYVSSCNFTTEIKVGGGPS